MKRKEFVRLTGMLAAGALVSPEALMSQSHSADFPIVRVPLNKRKFTSDAVEQTIKNFSQKVSNKELAWLFQNCFPNTLDTTVDFTMIGGKPDTYVITGDIDAMWLRDSTAQVWPYLSLIKEDKKLRQLVAGVINRQVKNILLDPYANAFYKDPRKISEWKDDATDMKPGIHERKWEIDSLCYPVRLAYHYWTISGDTSVFDEQWKKAAELTVKTFKQQQRKNSKGPYKFERRTTWATDGVPLGGYGYPAKPVGLIHSMFRPSDDATIFPFLIPSNFFAVVSLQQLSQIADSVYKDAAFSKECAGLAIEVQTALQEHAIVNHPKFGNVYAYEINGYGSYNIMDDANVPSLLALPYLGAVSNTDPIYINTRKLLLSEYNPFFFKGKAGEGIGGPHAGTDLIWPLSVIIRALTSDDDEEIKSCVGILQKSHAGTGFMHETFHKDDVSKFTRSWFAWANTIFGELLHKLVDSKPQLLT
ncbi:MAG: glycoside hydrolase family 125 protein [Ferruginibacter sp.]